MGQTHLALIFSLWWPEVELEGMLGSCNREGSGWVLGNGPSLEADWPLDQAPQDSGHGSKLPQFKKHLEMLSVLCSDIWVVLRGDRSWTQWPLWVPSDSGYSMIPPRFFWLPLSRNNVYAVAERYWHHYFLQKITILRESVGFSGPYFHNMARCRIFQKNVS